jgi:hypothetical protein
MELTGEQLIRAPRQKVWDALNDPSILSRCIPGCEEVDKVSDTETHARVTLKIGPVRARFAGKIFMSNVEPPAKCLLSFEGAGGAAGFAKGRSSVTLTGEGEATRLRYSVEASVGGKLGQIGGRLIDSSAKKMADEFFTAFNAALGGSIHPATAEAPSAAAPAPARPSSHIEPASPARGANAANAGAGFRQEIYRAFWFSFGAAFTLLLTRWLH